MCSRTDCQPLTEDLQPCHEIPRYDPTTLLPLTFFRHLDVFIVSVNSFHHLESFCVGCEVGISLYVHLHEAVAPAPHASCGVHTSSH